MIMKRNKTHIFLIKFKKSKVLQFSHIFLYLKAFDYLIPKEIRKIIFLTCYDTKTVHLLYYIFKKYQNIFDNSIQPNKKKYNDYILNIKISSKLIEFKEIQLEEIKSTKEQL